MKKHVNIQFFIALLLCCFALISRAGDLSHYSKVISKSSQLLDTDHSYSSSSKEYWFETNGAALMQGVAINNTSPRVLMLISQAREDVSSNTQQSDAKLDIGLMQLQTQSGEVVDSKQVSEPQLAQTGFLSKSAAMFTDKQAQDNGPLLLKTQQALDPQDRFLIMIREPDSDYALNLNTTSQSVDHNRTVLATVSMTLPANNGIKSKSLNPVNYLATLIGMDGSKVKLKSKMLNGQLVIQRPDLQNIIAPINGLYELLVEAQGNHNGLSFHRKGKLAFAFSRPTASFADTKVDVSNLDQAQVSVLVNEFSRYEVRAVLYGTKNGVLIPVLETQVAQSLNAGMAAMPLNFDRKLLNTAGVTAPYKVSNLRLYDQHQMALLEEYNEVNNVVLPGKPRFR
ncbi:DUF4785 domain-containing protein [Aliiglaciecola lipolytica]|uniref:DUF4785 domain-containing protein n=1 Tax=Aliiglaciecola lipolytica E3 TaxID=1127673 RepID=K6WZR0_9ALTE|nr:DUF4785 domain-containing protein [Aliiglaciecola lipolytica]GAC13899.1 hypothetical protein GLIP_1258 [Aliiglaciecola lipolytica E3]